MRVSLLDSTVTKSQIAVIGLWVAVLIGVFGAWSYTSLSLLTGGDLAGALLSIGRLLGLLATFFALTQFMLMGRIPWIERTFGLDRLASYHRFNGYAAIILIVLHPMFIINSYALSADKNVLAQYWEVIQTYPYAWLALIAEILFVTVVLSSIYIARKHLKFETWYFVHLMVYLAIVIVPFHQFALGGSLTAYPFVEKFWYGLYAFVALNILVFRFLIPFINFFTYGVTVSKVIRETPTTTSVYMKSSMFSKLKVHPGQFVLVRIFAKKLWWQEHPFSVSKVPGGNYELRLTIRNVGDYTSDIEGLKSGAKVLLSGPYGRFTKEVAVTDKRLYVAGGVGITPLLAMATESVGEGVDTVMLHGNTTEKDVVLASDAKKLVKKGLKLAYVFSKPSRSYKGETGYIDVNKIKRLVPDYKERDIYICGPPPMMDGLIENLPGAGVPEGHIHFERFSLHP